MLSRLFIAALWSPAVKGLTGWLLFVMFIVILILSQLVSWVWFVLDLSFPDPCCIFYFYEDHVSEIILNSWQVV